MGWMRLRTRPNAWLALFALALQLVVSFGHLHRDDLGLAPATAASSVASQTGFDLTGPPGLPGDRDHNSTSDTLCPVCASMSLAAALILPLAPRLDMPAAFVRDRLADAQTIARPSNVRLSFQARAPPLA